MIKQGSLETFPENPPFTRMRTQSNHHTTALGRETHNTARPDLNSVTMKAV
jgi:hypothetical protein